MKINIINTHNYKNIPTKTYLTDLIKNIIKKHVQLNINITNKKHIKTINKKYRNIDKETDILTFKNEIKIETHIGDIIICHQLVKNNTKNTFLIWRSIIIHGILHLLNYNHAKNLDNKIMMKIQKKIGMSGIEPPTTTTSK